MERVVNDFDERFVTQRSHVHTSKDEKVNYVVSCKRFELSVSRIYHSLGGVAPQSVATSQQRAHCISV